MSNPGTGEPFTSSPLIRFLINSTWGLMTPQLQHLMWPCAHKLVGAEAAYNSPAHDQYLYSTSTSDLYQGMPLSP